jgi:hypothetical protein
MSYLIGFLFCSLVYSLLSPSWFPAQQLPLMESHCTSFYVVQMDDTCTSISLYIGSSVAEIEFLNEGLDCSKDYIYQGQILCAGK